MSGFIQAPRPWGALSLADFREIWVADSEYIARPGEPVGPVVCYAAQEVRSGRVVRKWFDEFEDAPPIPIDEGVLYVSYAATAEAGAHLACGWDLPACTLDLHAEARNLLNGR